MNQAMSEVDPTGLCPVYSMNIMTYGGQTWHNWYRGDTDYACPPFGIGMGMSQGNPQPGSPFGSSDPGRSGAGSGGGSQAPNKYIKKPGPPPSRDCQGEANDAAIQAVKDNFNEGFVGVNLYVATVT